MIARTSYRARSPRTTVLNWDGVECALRQDLYQQPGCSGRADSLAATVCAMVRRALPDLPERHREGVLAYCRRVAQALI